MTSQPEFTFSPLIRPDDPLLPAWISLYESSFPVTERLPTQHILDLSLGQDEKQREVRAAAVLNLAGELIGLVVTNRPPGVPLLFFWYLALLPQYRCQGFGSSIYNQIIAAAPTGTEAVVLDVEDPAETASEPERCLRARRLALYRRLGARQLTGIDYKIQVTLDMPWQPMVLMVHPIQNITPTRAFDLIQQVIGPLWLKQVEELSLQ